MHTVQMRMPTPLLEAVDQAAVSRGLSRSEYVRGVLVAALKGETKPVKPPANVAPTLDEAVALLAEQARNGSASSTVALVKHLTAHDGAPAPDDPLAVVNRIAAEREHA